MTFLHRRRLLIPLLLLTVFSISSGVDSRIIRGDNNDPDGDNDNQQSGEIDGSHATSKNTRVVQLLSPRRTTLADQFQVALKDIITECYTSDQGYLICQFTVIIRLGPATLAARADTAFLIEEDEERLSVNGTFKVEPAIGKHPFQLYESTGKSSTPACFSVDAYKACIVLNDVTVDVKKHRSEGHFSITFCSTMFTFEMCQNVFVYHWEFYGTQQSKETTNVDRKSKKEKLAIEDEEEQKKVGGRSGRGNKKTKQQDKQKDNQSDEMDDDDVPSERNRKNR